MVQQARWLRHGARYPVRCWSQPARLLAASAHPPTDFGNVAAAAAGRAGARRDAGHRCGSRGLDIEKVGALLRRAVMNLMLNAWGIAQFQLIGDLGRDSGRGRQ